MANTWKMEYAVAVGCGPFAFDMLRYDRCFPASESDAHEMGRDHYQSDRFVIVARYKGQPGKWTIARWNSFGWRLSVAFDELMEAEDFINRISKEVKKV